MKETIMDKTENKEKEIKIINEITKEIDKETDII